MTLALTAYAATQAYLAEALSALSLTEQQVVAQAIWVQSIQLYVIARNDAASFSNLADAPWRIMCPTRTASWILDSSTPASRAFAT